MADHAAQIACCTRLDAGGALLGAGDDAPRSAGA